jgi:hypothetical protein
LISKRRLPPKFESFGTHFLPEKRAGNIRGWFSKVQAKGSEGKFKRRQVVLVIQGHHLSDDVLNEDGYSSFPASVGEYFLVFLINVY